MRYSTEEKAMWLEQWRNSGKSAWAYAKENGTVLYKYLTAVFEKAPSAVSTDDWEKLLP